MIDVKGFEGRYAVTADGKVWSYQQKKYLKPANNGHGYMYVNLSDASGKRYMKRVHRLVAEAYVANPDNKPVVNHIDLDRSNNDASNLEWVTYKENCNTQNGNRNASRQRSKIRCIETGVVYES